MFGRSLVLICLLMASIFTSAVVHAREVPGLPTLECSGEIHAEGDRDQTQGDADNGLPHHHSCHGTSVFIPAAVQGVSECATVIEQRPAMTSVSPARWSVGPGLRPPIA